MSHFDLRNDELVDVSKIAIARLSRFSSVDEQQVTQLFLFQANEFCGIRFVSGLFRAEWLIGNPNIEFSRGSQVIDQIPFGSGIDEYRKAG